MSTKNAKNLLYFETFLENRYASNIQELHNTQHRKKMKNLEACSQIIELF